MNSRLAKYGGQMYFKPDLVLIWIRHPCYTSILAAIFPLAQAGGCRYRLVSRTGGLPAFGQGGPVVAQFDLENNAFVGSVGLFPVSQGDQVTERLAMLVEGECELGPKFAAAKFGLSRQRYFQLRRQFFEQGAAGLAARKRGPKRNYRRTGEVVRQIIRHRFLDAEASAEVIAQKLRQTGFVISTRSVERTIAEYGLQKKTVSMPPAS